VTPAGFLGLLLALALAAVSSGSRAEKTARIPADEAVLERKRLGLERLLAATESGPLIAFDQVLVAVDQALVQELLSSAMPFERIIAGRYRIRLLGASVEFDDGFALIRLDGRGSFADAPEADAFAEVSVYGGLDVVQLDRRTGLLRGRVKLIAVEARQVGVMGVAAPVERFIEEVGHERLEAFEPLASSLEIPVRLEGDITIPAVGPEGGVRIAAASLPLDVGVLDVKAFRGRLWIAVGARVGTASGTASDAGTPSDGGTAPKEGPAS
jgi:hypothetical protein